MALLSTIRRLVCAGLVAVPITLSGCDSGAETPAVEAAPAAEPDSDAEASNARLPLPRPTGEDAIGARVYEYSIDLTRDTIDAGTVRFHVVNAGTTAHMFIVRDDDSYFATPHLVPGDSTILEIELPRGDYHVLCAVRDEFDHISEGERRDFVVR